MTEPVRTPAWYEEDNKRLRSWLERIVEEAKRRRAFLIELDAQRALNGETVTGKETE